MSCEHCQGQLQPPPWEVLDKTSQNDETAVGDRSLYGDGLQQITAGLQAGGPLQAALLQICDIAVAAPPKILLSTSGTFV